MTKPRAVFDVPINVCVVSAGSSPPREEHLGAVRQTLADADTIDVLTADQLGPEHGFDLAFVTNACGPTPVAAAVAAAGLPAMCIEPYRGFHAYHAAFYRELEDAGGTALPAELPEAMAASIRAVRCRRALCGMKLIVADPATDEHRNMLLRAFADGCRDRFGIEILIRNTDELKQRAVAYDVEAADAELQRWYAEVLTGPGEMNQDHMRQVARLYLAQRDMLEETGAVGITPHDIRGFLTIPEREIMPNVSYGPLVFDGYLACEEADIEALTTELLLYAGLGNHPTMSNIYFAFRDRFGALASHRDYTHELELADCRQCFEDNHVTVSHFSTAGVLPPNMMEEDRYVVREAAPSWPGQSMIWATPKLGPVALARLSTDAGSMHVVYGEADGLGFGDQYGWYRGRWFVRLPDAREFAQRCLHHHYAIAQVTGAHNVLDTLLFGLLRLDRR